MMYGLDDIEMLLMDSHYVTIDYRRPVKQWFVRIVRRKNGHCVVDAVQRELSVAVSECLEKYVGWLAMESADLPDDR